MDEETWLRLNGGKLLGTNLKPPETPEEIEEWIRERRRRFPTRERVAAKVKEEEEKKRKLAGASDASAETVRAQAPATSRQALATAQQPSQQKRKRTEQDPGNDYPSDSSLDSDADTNSQSSFPEELPTSKKPPPPSPTASTPSRKKSTKQAALCRVFRTTGKCRFGEGCRYRHVPPEGKRKKGGERKGAKSLYQRLLDQDREKENEIVVSAVRYLFERGALSVSEAGGGK
ncbi:unnamed protein product [Tuber melanosporum]|uniref:(Perigord truffle) hypothetical protein n=1 Tax=Tuber melanosporum (strain Mel28) TaxID=656061 RepID=D5G5W6_TUBMM|nr:uncharacterized protein GSTUM_00001603001 [Tuber melanosporum]CAZ79909.1 unnamed protein product [Tuber melanosporum]